MRDTTDRRIGRAALALSLILIAIVIATAAAAWWPRADIDVPAEWRADADYTLVIFGRSGCAACDTSTGFHRDLVAAAESRGIRSIAALTTRGEAPDIFAASVGLPADRAVMASPAPAHLTVVPTVVIVDRRGRVLTKKEGALSIDDRRALLSFVERIR